MLRTSLLILACVPVVLWGVSGFAPMTVPPAKPAPPLTADVPPRTKTVLASERALVESLGMPQTVPEARTGATEGHDAQALQARALAQAARFAWAFRRPLNEKGELVAKAEEFDNEALKQAWVKHAGQAKSAFDARARLDRTYDLKALRGKLADWLKAPLPERPEDWGGALAPLLKAAKDAVEAYAAFEADYPEQVELIETIRKPRAEWQKHYAVLKQFVEASDELTKADADRKGESLVEQVAGLGGLVHLLGARRQDVVGARQAVAKVCARLLPKRLLLDEKVICTRLPGKKDDPPKEYPAPRSEVEVEWKEKSRDTQKLGDGTDGRPTEFDVEAVKTRVYLVWKGNTYPGILPTELSKSADVYNRAAPKDGQWTAAALRQAHAACKDRLTRHARIWKALDALQAAAVACPPLFE